MRKQEPTSISELITHLSRKYSIATLDSQRHLDISPNQTRQICLSELQQSKDSQTSKHRSGSQANGSKTLSNQNTCKPQHARAHTKKQPNMVGYCTPKLKEKMTSQRLEFQEQEEIQESREKQQAEKDYARNLEELNWALKEELMAMRELMREQASVIDELAEGRY